VIRAGARSFSFNPASKWTATSRNIILSLRPTSRSDRRKRLRRIASTKIRASFPSSASFLFALPAVSLRRHDIRHFGRAAIWAASLLSTKFSGTLPIAAVRGLRGGKRRNLDYCSRHSIRGFASSDLPLKAYPPSCGRPSKPCLTRMSWMREIISGDAQARPAPELPKWVNCRDPAVLRKRRLHSSKLTNPPAQATFSSCHFRTFTSNKVVRRK